MKQVEKIWAELSAKAQEVETPQEVELSEEQKVELASVQIVEQLFEEGRQWLQGYKGDVKKMQSIAADKNKEAAKLASKMEQGAESLLKSAEKIGMSANDFPEAEATLKFAEKIAELQNAFARVAVMITKELT